MGGGGRAGSVRVGEKAFQSFYDQQSTDTGAKLNGFSHYIRNIPGISGVSIPDQRFLQSQVPSFAVSAFPVPPFTVPAFTATPREK